MYKKYVDVDVRWMKDGRILPAAILWESGGETERYEITKILSGPFARASSAGGTGKRYEIQIGNSRRYLFLEKDKWFIESAK